MNIVVMGVAGCGKSTIGAALADKLGLPFIEGDDYHPRSNRAKMSAGEPLTDDDRWPWLEALVAAMREQRGGCVLSCSALKHRYREVLRQIEVRFIYLKVSEQTVLARVRQRDHFFPESLVADQFATLEPPSETEALCVDVETSGPDVICESLVRHF